MKNLRKYIRESIRKTIKEESPDQEIVDSILDKINKQGKESLSDVEQDYLEQASTAGDIDPETEREMKKDVDIDSHVMHHIENDDIDNIDKSTLKKASQSVIDKYIDKLTERGEPIPPDLPDKASEEAVGRNIVSMVEKGFMPPEVMKHMPVPQQMRDEFIMKAAEEGKELDDDILEMGSIQAREEYKSKMR